MKAAIAFLVALLAIATLSGCGTMRSCSADEQEAWPIYGGVAQDLRLIEDTITQAFPSDDDPQTKNDPAPPTLWPVAVAVRACDLPLSAAADTLLLPITVTYSIARGMDRVDGAPLLSRQGWARFWGIEQPEPPPPAPSTPAK